MVIEMKGCRCRGSVLCDQCSALAEMAGLVTPTAPALTEAAWQSAVVRMLKDQGYMVFHVYDSRRSPHGWPDVAAIKPTGGPLYLCELKTDAGQCTRAQEAWLAALAGCTGVVSGVWRPSMLAHVSALFKGESHV